MIELREILKISKEHWDNLAKLQKAVTKLREAYGKPLTVSSGYRTLQDHLRIYAEKGITDQKLIPMKSKHLSGLAVDLTAADIKHFQKWIKDNISLAEELGLYFEDFSVTTTWVHCQITPPASGSRFFKP
jgi:uncharacterized protein YcbK (DUF882 family)